MPLRKDKKVEMSQDKQLRAEMEKRLAILNKRLEVITHKAGS